MTETSIIPVFFATDENYVPYLGVSLQSLIAHTAHNKQYEIYILHDSLSEHARQQLSEFKQKNVNISFLKVSDPPEKQSGFLESADLLSPGSAPADSKLRQNSLLRLRYGFP